MLINSETYQRETLSERPIRPPLMYSWSPNLSQISLKNSFGKVVFQILAEIEMMRNENRLFGRHFETVQIFYIFFLKFGCD